MTPASPVRALHVFAGAGGSILAGRLLGWESVGAVEIDPYCRAVLEHHGERILGHDVERFDASGLAGAVDIVVGGWPCQGNSTAGKRLGLADDRSNLWWQLLRVLVETRAPFLFAENVRGALTVNGGRDFGVILRSLADAGYDARWCVVSASDAAGAPHKRERLWLLAYRRELGDPRDHALGQRACREGRQDRERAPERREPGTAGEGAVGAASSVAEPLVPESRVGGTGHGVADDLADWPARNGHWPAGRGAPQYPYEAPRVVESRGQHRAPGHLQALKALGNGWVPHQAVAAFLTLVGCGQESSRENAVTPRGDVA